MGNLTSCLNFNSNIQSANIINSQGNLRQFKVPITAAEVMLMEQPGYVVSPVVNDLRSSFRLSALRADEMLHIGKLYYLIPVGRVNSFVSELELEMLRLGRDNKVKEVKRRRRGKVLPVEESGGGCTEDGGDGEGEGESGGLGRLSVCGSPMWTPVLETIYE